ncbi:putative metal-binding motif-containing protein [Polyangium spumosum]|uniref:Uncharacterized protein n=1 Tax=Polyangium spumosum TaxID=889282 RepID=A0A6N7PU99_9BACT|nr:putative metal-binding motif-containing protein [Polyangium spumosum]MRG92391.1 hypothetical protein [Polyangium spumosum]
MLKSCVSCEGFVPGSASSCPHCGAAVATSGAPSALAGLGKSLAALATGGAMAVTLMACYGLPPCESSVDADGDGVPACNDYGNSDCDDTNRDIHPGAEDPKGDGIDQNCDGVDGKAWDEPDAGDGGACISCAMGLSTLGTTDVDVCEGPALTAFQALKQCACQDVCAAVCQDNSFCTGVATPADCQACLDTQCSTQKLDCQEN